MVKNRKILMYILIVLIVTIAVLGIIFAAITNRDCLGGKNQKIASNLLRTTKLTDKPMRSER